MDGVTQVQARIGEIQSRFVSGARPATAGWASAASAAGLTGASEAGMYGATGGTASESAVVAEAQKYLGVPYLWGGTDPSKGLDCSGFTQWVYAQNGISIPRVTWQQFGAAQKTSNPQVGDLVSQNNGSHVGIYLGDGLMISALNPQQGTLVHSVDAMKLDGFYTVL